MFRDRIALVTISTLLLLTSVPYLLVFLLTPGDRLFLGSFNDPFDTPVYLSAMRVGARGEWLRTLPFTSEPHMAALYYPFYMLLGHIAPPTIITFHIARLVVVGWLCFAVWTLIADILPAQAERRVAFILALMGLGLGWLVLISGLWRIVRPTDLFAPTSTLFGAAFINPHFPLTAALQFATFSAYLRARAAPYQKGTLLLGALACFVMGWLVPFQLVVVALVLIADAALEVLHLRRVWTATTRAAFFILLPSGATIAYYFGLTRFAPFWAELVAQWPPLDHTFTPPEFVVGYGFLLILALMGALFLWRQKERSTGERLLLIWFIINSLLIASPFDFSDRTSLGFSALLAMLSAIALMRLAPTLPFFRRMQPQPQSEYQPRWAILLPRLTYMAVLPATLLLVLSHVLSVQQYNDSPYFLPLDDVAAIHWLSGHAQPQDVVLAAPTLSNQIPGLTDARVYSGHTHETFAPVRKNAEIKIFFDAGTSDADRKDFLKQHGITYVYAKSGARGLGTFDGVNADYLERVFTSHNINLYRVK